MTAKSSNQLGTMSDEISSLNKFASEIILGSALLKDILSIVPEQI